MTFFTAETQVLLELTPTMVGWLDNWPLLRLDTCSFTGDVDICNYALSGRLQDHEKQIKPSVNVASQMLIFTWLRSSSPQPLLGSQQRRLGMWRKSPSSSSCTATIVADAIC